MFKFLFSKSFVINLSISLVFAGCIIWGIFKFIDHYTLHNQTISVPNLEGLTLKETAALLNEKTLRFTILDSIYIAEADKGVVLEQNPAATDLVKENRTIYITISKVIPPNISMPDVVDMSLRLAVAKLESYGLKVKTQYIPSECVNCVLIQEVDGKEVSLNDKITKGSTVLLTIGKGTSDEKVLVPLLKGLTKLEAEKKLIRTSLNIGFSDYENCQCETREDSLNAKVYRHNPMRNIEVAINMGSSVDLYFTCDTSMIILTPSDTISSTNTFVQE
jgi:beta-lactam-binding protein with PASTA domain